MPLNSGQFATQLRSTATSAKELKIMLLLAVRGPSSPQSIAAALTGRADAAAPPVAVILDSLVQAGLVANGAGGYIVDVAPPAPPAK